MAVVDAALEYCFRQVFLETGPREPVTIFERFAAPKF
jgi:hypothetical protein